MHQPCFASMAILKILNLLNPKPPKNFDVQILSQLTQWILRSLSFCTYQKFFIKLSSSVHRVVGSLKQLIAYMGIAKAIASKRISLPPWDKSFPFHNCRRCHIFVLILENAFFFAFPTIGGRLRYFSYWVTPLHPQVAITSFLVSSCTFLLNTIVVLSLLIHWPDTNSYCYNKLYSFWEVSMVAL